MKIALIQTNPIVGDIEGNKKKILKGVGKAREDGVRLVIFTEMALLGYPPRDLLEIPSLVEACEKAAVEIARESSEMAILFGGISKNPEQTGKRLFNTAFWCEGGKIGACFHKTLLPSYDVFDETRYFEPSKNTGLIEFDGLKIGVTICEDIWNDPAFPERHLYSSDPVLELRAKGCDLIINLSASPYSLGKYEQRLAIISRAAQRGKAVVVYVNQVGGNDELIFDGGSLVVNAEGRLLSQAPFFKEGMTIVDLDQKTEWAAEEPDEMVLLEEALITGLRDYVKKCGFKKVALGLSGGIDSALTACLAVQALGSKNVLGLIMPSRYSSAGSVRDARALAENLKMPVREISIEPVHRAYEKTFPRIFGRKKPDTTEENVQARIRGNLLMAASNKLGCLVLSTGNKSELAVGYCTLYGDMAGGLAVISDVPKTLVYSLCAHINRRKEIIPKASLTKPPSAELKHNQTDQDSLPPYDVLDGIMKAFVEDLKSEAEIIRMGYKPDVVKKVLRMILANEYKRRQAAPGLKVTSKAFGTGRRFPIACKV